MQKIPNGFISPQMSNFHTWWYSEDWCDDQPVAEEASAEPDGQQKQDVLVLSALVSYPEVPCLPCEPCMFDMILEDDDGLYVEDHSEGLTCA